MYSHVYIAGKCEVCEICETKRRVRWKRSTLYIRTNGKQWGEANVKLNGERGRRETTRRKTWEKSKSVEREQKRRRTGRGEERRRGAPCNNVMCSMLSSRTGEINAVLKLCERVRVCVCVCVCVCAFGFMCVCVHYLQCECSSNCCKVSFNAGASIKTITHPHRHTRTHTHAHTHAHTHTHTHTHRCGEQIVWNRILKENMNMFLNPWFASWIIQCLVTSSTSHTYFEYLTKFLDTKKNPLGKKWPSVESIDPTEGLFWSWNIGIPPTLGQPTLFILGQVNPVLC